MFLGASAASECAETEHPVLPWLPLSCSAAAAALISQLSLFENQGGFFSSPSTLLLPPEWTVWSNQVENAPPLPPHPTPPSLLVSSWDYFLCVCSEAIFFFFLPRRSFLQICAL